MYLANKLNLGIRTLSKMMNPLSEVGPLKTGPILPAFTPIKKEINFTLNYHAPYMSIVWKQIS